MPLQIRENLRRYPLIFEVARSEALREFSLGGGGASVIEDKEAFVRRLDVIDNGACSWIALMSGLSLNMFRGFSTEEDLMAYFKGRAYFDNVTVLASTSVRWAGRADDAREGKEKWVPSRCSCTQMLLFNKL